jgi:hypothetical protein
MYYKTIFFFFPCPYFLGFFFKKLLSYTLFVPMIDGLHSPHRPQEHRLSAHWSVGTSERATTAGASSQLTTMCISGAGAF